VIIDDDNRNEPLDEADLGELLPAWALGALDSEEAERVAGGIEASPELRAEARRDEELVGRLGLGVPLTAPPASVRERVLSSVRVEPAEPVMLPVGRVERLQRWGLAAAAILVLALAGLSGILLERLGQRDDEIAALEQAVAAREGEIASLRQEVEARAVNFDQPLVWTPFEVTAPGHETSIGYFSRSADGTVGWVIVTGSVIPPDQVLQLWFIEDGNPISAGTFVTDAEGRGMMEVHPVQHETLEEIPMVGITVEPMGGSPAPTSPPMMAAEIT
jgi:anti-sigma-K factor RskA